MPSRMKKRASMLGLLGLFAAVGGGCGTVCDDADDICPQVASSASASADADEECTEQAECVAQCVVDADSCDFTDETLVECVNACEA